MWWQALATVIVLGVLGVVLGLLLRLWPACGISTPCIMARAN